MMFTGLIQRVGTIQGLETGDGGCRLLISAGEWRAVSGESISVSGVCLTVSGLRDDIFACDVLQETLKKTTLGEKRPGAPVNLERALEVGGAMGGHIVTGHVDGCGIVVQRKPLGKNMMLRIACDRSLLNGMVLKGSVACDGASLTITRLFTDSDAGDGFESHLVPHTISNTTLEQTKEGDKINIETDMIGKYVYKYMNPYCENAGAVAMERLYKAGF